MAGTTVNQNGGNAAALRREAHTSGVCGFGGDGSGILFGYTLPASVYLPQTLWQEISLIFTTNRRQQLRKPANLNEKAGVNIK